MFQSRLLVRISTLLGLFVFGLLSVNAAYAATYTISISPTQFVPATLKINAGDSINFLNTTSATQSARSSVASGFNTGNIGPGQSKMVTVTNAGTYTYTSAFNSALSGTVEVAAGTGGLTSSPSATTTSTTSSTITSQPAKTQSQPVSGVEEVLMGVVAVGLAALGAGWYARQRVQNHLYSELVDVPLVRVNEAPTLHD